MHLLDLQLCRQLISSALTVEAHHSLTGVRVEQKKKASFARTSSIELAPALLQEGMPGSSVLPDVFSVASRLTISRIGLDSLATGDWPYASSFSIGGHRHCG